MAKAFPVFNDITVVDAKEVTVQPVQNFQSLLNQNINFASFRQAVMINENLLVGPKISEITKATNSRQ